MLKSGVLKLRRLVDSDNLRIAEMANNRKIWKNLRDLFPHPYFQEHARDFIAKSEEEEPPVTFGIEYKGELCGVIGLGPQNDVYRKSAEIGYWIGEEFWGRGIASNAVCIITKYGFEKLGLIRIHTGVYEYNIASMRVLEKNGFFKEGIFRNSVFKDGKILDEHRYSLVR